MDVNKAFNFARERHAIYLKRAAGLPSPWTDDPILAEWKFTNVYRELDRVTVWLRENWREPHADNPDLWFAMAVARFVNWPDTLAEIGFPMPWDRVHFLAVMNNRKARGVKVYGSAYLIRAEAQGGRDTPTYQADAVFTPLWRQRETLRPRNGETLSSYNSRLAHNHGMGAGFMEAQIVADLKFSKPLLDASDWWTFAVSGPGSRRGLNRILGRPKDARWDEREWRRQNELLRQALNVRFAEVDMPQLSGQDCNNLCCEIDKFERVRLGEGKPRARFRPTVEG